MEHDILFGAISAYDEWGLVPTTRPSIPAAPVDVKTLQIPGSNTHLNLTNIFGDPSMQMVETPLEFFCEKSTDRNWADIYTDIKMRIHGKQMLITLLDDPMWAYDSIVTVGPWRSEEDGSYVTINIKSQPYRYNIGYGDGECWLVNNMRMDLPNIQTLFDDGVMTGPIDKDHPWYLLAPYEDKEFTMRFKKNNSYSYVVTVATEDGAMSFNPTLVSGTLMDRTYKVTVTGHKVIKITASSLASHGMTLTIDGYGPMRRL